MGSSPEHFYKPHSQLINIPEARVYIFSAIRRRFINYFLLPRAEAVLSRHGAGSVSAVQRKP